MSVQEKRNVTFAANKMDLITFIRRELGKVAIRITLASLLKRTARLAERDVILGKTIGRPHEPAARGQDKHVFLPEMPHELFICAVLVETPGFIETERIAFPRVVSLERFSIGLPVRTDIVGTRKSHVLTAVRLFRLRDEVHTPAVAIPPIASAWSLGGRTLNNNLQFAPLILASSLWSHHMP